MDLLHLYIFFHIISINAVIFLPLISSIVSQCHYLIFVINLLLTGSIIFLQYMYNLLNSIKLY